MFVAALALSAAVVAGCSSSTKDQTPISGTIPTTTAPAVTTTTVMGGMATTTTMAAGGMATTTTVGQ